MGKAPVARRRCAERSELLRTSRLWAERTRQKAYAVARNRMQTRVTDLLACGCARTRVSRSTQVSCSLCMCSVFVSVGQSVIWGKCVGSLNAWFPAFRSSTWFCGAAPINRSGTGPLVATCLLTNIRFFTPTVGPWAQETYVKWRLCQIPWIRVRGCTGDLVSRTQNGCS